MVATTAEKKDTSKATVLPGEREMLYEIVGLPKSKTETDADKEDTDLLPTLLATNIDSRGPPPSARR